MKIIEVGRKLNALVREVVGEQLEIESCEGVDLVGWQVGRCGLILEWGTDTDEDPTAVLRISRDPEGEDGSNEPLLALAFEDVEAGDDLGPNARLFRGETCPDELCDWDEGVSDGVEKGLEWAENLVKIFMAYSTGA